MNRDYQWPESIFKKNFMTFANDHISTLHIERYFSKLLHARCYLFPSARSALSAVLHFNNINRNHTLFAPKWSSHCVWDVLARYGNPCALYSEDIDVTLNVNKWGLKFTSNGASSLQINDSVDSIFINDADLFHGANYELISLPKTIGSFSGGLLVTNDENIGNYIDELRESSILSLAKKQEQLKIEITMGKTNDYSWQEFDWKNFLILKSALVNINNCMENYHVAQQVIKVRLKKVQCKIDLEYLNLSDNRLPCLLPIKIKSPQSFTAEKIMTRMFNFSQKNEDDNFEVAQLLPLHIGISTDEFTEFLTILSSSVDLQ
jgi:putative PLP-dependent aminotransferase (TIGR04422 family)